MFGFSAPQRPILGNFVKLSKVLQNDQSSHFNTRKLSTQKPLIGAFLIALLLIVVLSL